MILLFLHFSPFYLQATNRDPSLDFNKHRPKFVTEPSSFLEAPFQNLFSIHYFADPKSLLPTGWNEVEEDKTYPALSTRAPRVQEMSDYDDELGEATAETSDEDGSGQDSYQPRVVSESERSEDELSAPTIPTVSTKSLFSRVHPFTLVLKHLFPESFF